MILAQLDDYSSLDIICFIPETGRKLISINYNLQVSTNDVRSCRICQMYSHSKVFGKRLSFP